MIMNKELKSIKHQLDITIGELDIFYPLINSMFIKSIENINFELFKDGVIKFNNAYSLRLFSDVSIKKVISDAKLFLNSQELERFYLFAKDEVLIRQNHLTQMTSIQRKLTEHEEIELERIFNENCNIGLFGFPTKGIIPNINFSKQLITGIETHFKYFENKIDELNIFKSEQPIKNIEEKISMKVIALLYYYNDNFITRDNGQEIAVKYKYTSKTSGEGLYQDFIYFQDNANRKASGETKVKCNNRIKLQKIVIELLTNEEAKLKAESELAILKTKLKSIS